MDLQLVAPAFVDTAHGIGMCVTATVDAAGRPRTRVMQPVWAWDGTALVGWVSTSTADPKVRHLARVPVLALTYWSPAQDVATADCDVERLDDPAELAAAWDRFLATPAPAGFDPAIHPDWESPASPTFGVLRLRPHRLRVLPGSLMTEGVGEVLTWREDAGRG